MPSLFAYLVRALRHTFALVLVFAMLMEAAALFLEEGGGTALLVPTFIFYGALFRVILLRPRRIWALQWEAEDGTPLDLVAFQPRFIGVGLLFFLACILPPVFAVVFLGPGLAVARDAWKGLAILLCFPWTGLVLTFFGTQLAASAMGRRLSLGKTLRAARKTWWKVFLQLALIPLPLLAASGALLYFVGPAAYLDWPSPVISFAMSVVAGVVFSIPMVLTLAILCRAYEQAYPAEDPAPAPRVHTAWAPGSVPAVQPIPARDPASGSLIIHAPVGTPDNR